MSQPKILLENVSKYHHSGKERLVVLENLNLEIEDGEFFCLVGPSGCGKSTLINILAGFSQPSSGRVLIEGKEITHPNPKYVAIFQEYGLFPWMTVLDNVKFGLEMNGVNKEEQTRIAQCYTTMVRLNGFENQYPHTLSGGMRQRVSIARTLAVDPEIIFLDEPFNALDLMVRMDLQDEILRIWSERRRTIFCITHDIDEAVYLADRIVVMSRLPGRIINTIRVNLPHPRDRLSSRFTRIKSEVWQTLCDNHVITEL